MKIAERNFEFDLSAEDVESLLGFDYEIIKTSKAIYELYFLGVSSFERCVYKKPSSSFFFLYRYLIFLKSLRMLRLSGTQGDLLRRNSEVK